MPAAEIDWDQLREAARQVMERAYVPYSEFPVGVAALVDDGRVIVGCNVENASYGLSLCAECALVSALHVSGGAGGVQLRGQTRQQTDAVRPVPPTAVGTRRRKTLG